MALKDTTQHFTGLGDLAATPDEVEVPNSVSRSLKLGERAFLDVVGQSAKALLDSELNAKDAVQGMSDMLLRRWHTSSGWLRGVARPDVYADYFLGIQAGIVDSTGTHKNGDTLLDAFGLNKLEAIVANMPVVVEYANTTTAGKNLVVLSPPTAYDGTPGTFKRTDFVFLEVWKALVAPSLKASGSVQVVVNASLAPGDRVIINGLNLTATAGAPGVDQFQIGANAAATAVNIAAAINSAPNSFDTIVTAIASTDTVVIKAKTPGSAGNAITLAVTVVVPGAMTASGAALTGGANRPNKPASEQGKIFRHGNTESPSATWLDDEIFDPALDVETTQRVQVQYRIRATNATEGVNYKVYPDGFSNGVVYARGARSAVQAAYPFVQADGAKTAGSSSAVAYGIVDNGLWVAGDGTSAAAQVLGTLDGFVYAIPLCFVFRHNNASTPGSGFNPQLNSNGAPLYGHAGYAGSLGVAIVAGESDRPDNEFANVIAQSRLLDLRRHVAPAGVDLASEVSYQMQSLLDGSLRTWATDAADKQTMGNGSGDVSTWPLVCNQIGRSTAAQGPAGTTSGPLVRNFDHTARRFADQSVVERVVFAYYPGDRVVGPVVAPGTVNAGKYVTKAGGGDAAKWSEGDTLVLDLTAWDATTLGGTFHGLNSAPGSGGALASKTWDAFAPSNAVVTDVLSMFHDDGHYDAAVSQVVQAKSIKGLGTRKLEIVLDDNNTVVSGGLNPAVPNPTYRMVDPVEGSARRIFVEVELTYPAGIGTTDTFQYAAVPDTTTYPAAPSLTASIAGPGPMTEVDISQRPNDMESKLAPRFRQGFREIQLEYVANDTIAYGPGDRKPLKPIGTTVANGGNGPEQIVSRDAATLIFPRRVYDGRAGLSVKDVTTALADKAVDTALTEFGSSSRKVVLAAPFAGPAGQRLCQITYYAQDPVPSYGGANNGWQVGVFWRTNAPQTAGVKDGDISTSAAGGSVPTTLVVEPLVVGGNLWSGQRGTGSQELAFPWATPLDQIPVNDGTALNLADFVAGSTKDWYFSGSVDISTENFDANTGLLALHPYIQADSQGLLTLGGVADTKKPRKDAEWRAFYPFADDTTYRPTLVAEPLKGAVRHKVMIPYLCRATADVPGVSGGLLYRKGELLLVVLTRFAAFDAQNDIRFISPDADNRTCAGVYRTKGLLLVVGERS